MHTLNSSSPRVPTQKGSWEESSLSKPIQALPASRNKAQLRWRPSIHLAEADKELSKSDKTEWDQSL